MPIPPTEPGLRIAMIGPFGLDPKATMRARAVPAARALAQRGHQVLVAMPPWHTPDEGPRVWMDGDVTMAYCDVGALRVPVAGHAIVGTRLARIAARWRPDVVHVFKPKAYAGLAADALRAARVFGGGPAIVQDTDDWEGAGGWNELESYSAALRVFFAWQEQWGLARADSVTAASRSLGERAGGGRRTHYVPNALDDEALGRLGAAIAQRVTRPPTVPTLVLYTRFFEFRVATVVQILRAVRALVPGTRLLVAGRSFFGEEEALRAEAAAAEVGDAIDFRGWVAPADLPDVLAGADVALYPFLDTLVNRTKFPVKLLELMASGLPVVADAVGEPATVIQDEVSGSLVTPGDVGAFAQAAAILLQSPARRAEIGAAARARVQADYRWAVLAPGLEEIYAATIAGRRGGRPSGLSPTDVVTPRLGAAASVEQSREADGEEPVP